MTLSALERLREQLDLTQREMADLLQCDYTGYKRYATGARPMPAYIARSVAALEFIHQAGLLDAYRTHIGHLQR